jgi:hypothetical protein
MISASARWSLPGIGRTHGRLLCIIIALSVPANPVLSEEPPQPTVMVPSIPSPQAAEPETADPLITLRGSVWRTKAGIVFLKTPIGLLTLSSRTTLKDLKASHEVLFWVHQQHSMVDIRRRSDGSLVHRYLTGPMTLGADDSKTLRWWTPDGEITTQMGAQEGRIGAFHEGDVLTVEVDDTQSILGVHDLQYDLQITQVAPSGAQAQVLLSGTVSKLKSNFVFFRTPIGLVMVNGKIGLPHVKVGQSITLQIDGPEVSVDLQPRADKPTREESTPSAKPDSPPAP